MTTFDSREKLFEDKYAHDAEMTFKARARRNRMFGEWIASELGLVSDDVGQYAEAVIKADLQEEGDEDIYRKVMADLETAGIDISRHRLTKQLDEFMVTAKAQLATET